MSPTNSRNRLTSKHSPPDVAVVGGGIVGLASAYSLAERGANVTVFEQSSIGNGSTGLAAGGIRTQFNRKADIRMMIESVNVWESFQEDFGVDIRYRQNGYLLGIQEASRARDMQRVLARQRELGLDNRLLDPAEATAHCPGLNPDQFEAVAYGPTDGYADPASALMGFKEAAEGAGATIRTNCPVTGVKQSANGTVIGVKTEDGCHRADAIVNAAGAWAPAFAEAADVALPIEPKARRAATVEPERAPEGGIPLVVDFGSGVYFRPLDDEQLLVGGHFDDALADASSADPTVDPAPRPSAAAPLDWRVAALERAADCASYFGPDARVVDSWEGRYGMSPDENPIIEESQPGLYTAAGFSGHGMMMAPATGQLVADLILGNDPLVDPAAYSTVRFEDNEGSHDNTDAISQF